ncbi:PAS domain-containing protein [Halomicroarcula sp. GCM10025709]|uniref:PAS domain-containing protein n=1 Tax=Halomicroarcula sp. GCM10025709 TaxID=3252669 RepID=UPI003615A6ED
MGITDEILRGRFIVGSDRFSTEVSTTNRFRLLFVTKPGSQNAAIGPELTAIPQFTVETIPELTDETETTLLERVDCLLLSGRFDDATIERGVLIARNRAPGTPVILVLTDQEDQPPGEAVLAKADDYLFDGAEKMPRTVLKHRVLSTIENSRARTELHRHRDFLRRTEELGDIGGWEYDLDSEELRWTEHVYEIHELPHEYELSVDDALDFYHEKDRPQLREKLETLFETGDPFSVQVRLVTARGNVRWVRVRGDADVRNGQVQRRVASYRTLPGSSNSEWRRRDCVSSSGKKRPGSSGCRESFRTNCGTR